jgi:hypothetical protein
MKTKFCCLSCILIASFSILPDVRAQVVLIGDYPSTDGTGSTITTLAWKAVSFSIPSNPGTSYDINDVVLRLGNYTAATTPNPSIGFFTDTGTQPGTLIGSLLTDAPLSGNTANGDFSFVPSGTLNLAAGATYWLVIGAAGGSFQSRETTSAFASDVSATGGTFLRSTDGGGTWLSSGVRNAFQVNATPVPEPVHYTLGGAIALLAFAGYRRYQTGGQRPAA